MGVKKQIDAALYNEILKLTELPLKTGDLWYIIDTHWFEQWKKFQTASADIVDGSMDPGPIDNSGILERESTSGEYKLKPNLIDNVDYILLPEEAYSKLKSLCGIVANQLEIQRYVIESGMFVKQTKIEIYPFRFTLCFYDSEDRKEKVVISRSKCMSDLISEVRKLFLLPYSEPIRIIIKHQDGNLELMQLKESTCISESGLYSDQVLLIDCQNTDGVWKYKEPVKMDTDTSLDESKRAPVHKSVPQQSLGQSSITSSASEPSFSYSNTGRKSEAPGLCGLSNLGNTCFMNSGLQCMSNTSPLTEYLLSGRYVSEINEENPLGMKGEMARAYAELIKNLWSNKSGSIIPRNFKNTVGRFAPTFSGYQQQDSQELLAFLLDGLHEDLNRVKKKPFVEMKDTDGKSDAVAAAEAWDNYKKRNDSVVIDLFHALLKSTLVCPQCNKVSVTFDPYSHLPLPLPMKKERNIIVHFVPFDSGEQITKYKVTVPKSGTITDLLEGLSRLNDKLTKRLIVTDVYGNRFHKVFTPNDLLTSILDRDDIFVYETDDYGDSDSPVCVCFYNRLCRKSSSSFGFSSGTSLCGIPTIGVLKKDQINYNSLYAAAKQAVTRVVDFPDDDDVWCINDNENDSGVDDNDDSNNADDTGSKKTQASSSSAATGADPALFKIVVTNSYGTYDMSHVGPGKEITVEDANSVMYISLEWNPLAEKFLDVKPTLVDHESMCAVKGPKKNIQLSECFDLFTTTEKLGKDDLWFCPTCKEHQKATKKLDLWSVPEILIVQLKRFSYNRFLRDKIEGLVECPLEGLDVSPWSINEKNAGVLYDLIGVSNHYGGMGGGHYTANAKNKITNRWYCFDDSSVAAIDDSDVVTKAAYVLVYARRQKIVHKESDPNVEMEDVEN